MADAFTWPFYAAALAALFAVIPALMTGRRLGEHEGHHEMSRADRLEAERGGSPTDVDAARAEAARAGPGDRRRGREGRELVHRLMDGRGHETASVGGGVRPTAAAAAGRRPGDSGTREAILEAARAAFAELGYEKATIRGIAAQAEVDAALVCHYFGTKDELFAAALELPVRPREIFERAIAGEREQIGFIITRTFLEAWEPPETRVRLMAMLRSAMTNDTAMAMVREVLTREVFGPITEILGVANGPLRATLVGSQFVGLAVMRYIGRLEPLASASIDELVAAVGPTVQRYLTGELSEVEAETAG